MISAPEFVKNMDTNNLIDVLMNHFDQVMTLYNIIGRRDDIDVMVDNKNEKIKFGLLLETPENAAKLYSILNGTLVKTYDTKFCINMTITKNRVTVAFNKAD